MTRRKDPAQAADEVLDNLHNEPMALQCNLCGHTENFEQPGMRTKLIDHLLDQHPDRFKGVRT